MVFTGVIHVAIEAPDHEAAEQLVVELGGLVGAWPSVTDVATYDVKAMP